MNADKNNSSHCFYRGDQKTGPASLPARFEGIAFSLEREPCSELARESPRQCAARGVDEAKGFAKRHEQHTAAGFHGRVRSTVLVLKKKQYLRNGPPGK